MPGSASLIRHNSVVRVLFPSSFRDLKHSGSERTRGERLPACDAHICMCRTNSTSHGVQRNSPSGV